MWSDWLMSLRGAPRPSHGTHRLRPSIRTAAVQLLETRLYLGALPGTDAVAWGETDTTPPPEPAIVELVSYESSVTEAETSQSLGTAESPSLEATDSASDATNALSGTTQSAPEEPTSDEIVTTLLATELPAAIDEGTTQAAGDSSNVESRASAPVTTATSSEDSGDDPVLEVVDPEAGGAQAGSIPILLSDGTDSSSSAAPSNAVVSHGDSAAIAELLTSANSEDPLVIKYDFRDQGEFANSLTAEQMAVVEQAMQDWELALHGAVRFERDTAAPDDAILNVGMGDLALFNGRSAERGSLGLGGGTLSFAEDGTPQLQGVVWLDQAENWDNEIGNGDVAGTFDLYTVASHELGHVLGLEDALPNDDTILNGGYQGERTIVDLYNTVATSGLLDYSPWNEGETFEVDASPMIADPNQITMAEVQERLEFASTVTPSNDAIIAIVDRNGRILGVRVEQDVLDTITDTATLVFAIDGAVAKARTAAFFANGDPTNVDDYSPNGNATPLTSRLVRFISQSTVTEREVNSNPNIQDPDSTERGPGFVAPIGVGGHFPPEIQHTPPVDLFGIEHTNRDSIINPGLDGIRGTADDFELRSRFNIDPTYVDAGQELYAPESYGFVSGLDPDAQSRGIATLPGGIPLFRDTNMDGYGDTLVGGVGVFFPGTDGYASFEQNFIAGIGQTEYERTNAPKVLEAELIALLTAGGSVGAFQDGADQVTPSLTDAFDVPFGRLNLVGIELEVIGPTPGIQGVIDLLNFGLQLTGGQAFGTFASSGIDMPLDAGLDGMFFTPDDTLYDDGYVVPDGWLVNPHDSTVDNLTAADVEQLVNQAIAAAELTRSAIRLTGDPSDPRPGARARMVIAVADTSGEILGLYRMQDSTVFSIDVAVAKSRNTGYYADATALQPEDQVDGIDAGTAFTNRTFRFLSEARYPSGVDGSEPSPFSILNAPGIDPATGENIGAPLPASVYDGTVVGYDAFNPMTNFHDLGDASVVAAGGVSQPTANQNGVIFFPGSTPIYQNDGTELVGGFGISGDGVDQDDVVTALGSDGYLPDGQTVIRADQTFVRDVRLPYSKFLRNPFG
ncbi:matrixin family metalloprotease [bacterium]|nr:matrixin family metalloprotease [bacterium]